MADSDEGSEYEEDGVAVGSSELDSLSDSVPVGSSVAAGSSLESGFIVAHSSVADSVGLGLGEAVDSDGLDDAVDSDGAGLVDDVVAEGEGLAVWSSDGEELAVWSGVGPVLAVLLGEADSSGQEVGVGSAATPTVVSLLVVDGWVVVVLAASGSSVATGVGLGLGAGSGSVGSSEGVGCGRAWARTLSSSSEVVTGVGVGSAVAVSSTSWLSPKKREALRTTWRADSGEVVATTPPVAPTAAVVPSSTLTIAAAVTRVVHRRACGATGCSERTALTRWMRARWFARVASLAGRRRRRPSSSRRADVSSGRGANRSGAMSR